MGVEFNEPVSGDRTRSTKRLSFFSRTIINFGLAKNEAGAQTVLLILSVLCLIGAGFLYAGMAKHPLPPSPDDTRLGSHL